MNVVWHWLGAITLWYLGLYLGLLKQHRGVFISAILSIIAALLWMGALSYQYLSIAPHEIGPLHCSLAFLALLTSAALLLITRPVAVALTFALVTVAMSVLLLVHGAAFLMAALVIIYAGAIVVTFLFVIMLAQQRSVPAYDVRPREPLLASLAGWALSLCLVVVGVALTDSSHFPARNLERSAPRHLEDSRTLVQTIRVMEQALEMLVVAMEQQRPREEIIEILDTRPFERVTFTKAMESLRKSRIWLADNRIRPLQSLIEQNYESLLAALAKDPPDYTSALTAARCGMDGLQRYRNLAEGARTLTRIDAEPTTRGLGKALFGYYAFPVPVAGFLLLLATIGTFIMGKSSQAHLGEPVYEQPD